MSEPEITTISENGQVVIPQKLRDMLGITPKTKLLIYGYGDTIIVNYPALKGEACSYKPLVD